MEIATHKPLKVLLLCHYYDGAAGTIFDHIFSFVKYSENDYYVLSNLGELPHWLEIERFDGILIHYSLIACHDNFIPLKVRSLIRNYKGFKAVFIQDDYRWVNDTVAALAYMKINALFPLTNPDIMDTVYSPVKLPGVRKETVLTGYVPEQYLGMQVKRYEDRPIDVGYRARKLPAWMGSHTLQKWQISQRFAEDAPSFGLNVDLSCREEDRIYGDDWIVFLTNCKATLGTESGASICDFTGDIQRNVESHLATFPNSDFETLRDLYFANEDGKVMMNVISPRCFEAASLRTMLILYEGEYSNVLVPGRHYVPLNKDHSNMSEVVAILNNPKLANEIIDNAYYEVACNPNYTFKHMIHLVDKVFREEFKESMRSIISPYEHEEFNWRKSAADKAIKITSISTHENQDSAGNGDNFKMINLDVILVKPMEISSIAFNLFYHPIDNKIVVRVYNCEKQQYCVTIKASEAIKFQLANFKPRLPRGDKVTITISAPGEAVGDAIELLEIQGVSSELKKLTTSLNHFLIDKLEILWSKTPDTIRCIMRPAARLIRKSLS